MEKVPEDDAAPEDDLAPFPGRAIERSLKDIDFDTFEDDEDYNDAAHKVILPGISYDAEYGCALCAACSVYA